MSYTPTEWKSGDVVTSQKLNKLEEGVANAGGGGLLLICAEQDEQTMVLNYTFGEIKAAVRAGGAIYIKLDMDQTELYYPLYALSCGTNGGGCVSIYVDLIVEFVCNSDDAYPVYSSDVAPPA